MEWSEIPRFSSWGKYTCDVTLNDLESNLKVYINEYGLDLNPDFQRSHVWTEKKRIEYVEYILKGGRNSRHIIFNHPNWMSTFEGDMQLVDGKQRLESTRMFLNNELPVFNGIYRRDFTNNGKQIKRFSSEIFFTFYINNLPTRVELLQFYLDLNTGGVVHSDEEIERVKQLLVKEQKKENLREISSIIQEIGGYK